MLYCDSHLQIANSEANRFEQLYKVKSYLHKTGCKKINRILNNPLLTFNRNKTHPKSRECTVVMVILQFICSIVTLFPQLLC